MHPCKINGKRCTGRYCNYSISTLTKCQQLSHLGTAETKLFIKIINQKMNKNQIRKKKIVWKKRRQYPGKTPRFGNSSHSLSEAVCRPSAWWRGSELPDRSDDSPSSSETAQELNNLWGRKHWSAWCVQVWKSFPLFSRRGLEFDVRPQICHC